jgi:hypothetical protein
MATAAAISRMVQMTYPQTGSRLKARKTGIPARVPKVPGDFGRCPRKAPEARNRVRVSPGLLLLLSWMARSCSGPEKIVP